MSIWVKQSAIKAVKLPSGAWVRIDRVDAVEELMGHVYVVLSCGKSVKASFKPYAKSASEIIKMIWEATDD